MEQYEMNRKNKDKITLKITKNERKMVVGITKNEHGTKMSYR